jgi:hypothetical protein
MPQVAHPREAQLILLSAVAAPATERLRAIRALARAGVDWDLVMRAVMRQGVLPLVYHSLSAALSSELPSAVHQRMHREFQGNALRNLHLRTELLRLCGLLQSHGVRALALKGPALAASVLRDVALRQFTDLDLLVRECDLAAALEALEADGFRQAPLHGLAVGKVPGCWEVALTRAQGLFTVDLHWRLSPPYFPFTPEGEDLWTRAIEVDLGPGPVLTLGDEDLMLFLCAHGAKHGWQTLSGVCDISEATRAYQYDWESLAARANSVGSLRMLLLGGLLAHDMLGAEIPPSVIARARGEHSVTRAAMMFSRYFYELGEEGPGLFQRWSIPVALIPGRTERLRYLFGRTFLLAADDLNFVELPQQLLPIYYVVRPLRLATVVFRALMGIPLRTSGLEQTSKEESPLISNSSD